MKILKFNVLFLITVALLFQTSAAQQKEANISFEKIKHDLGKINEADGVKTYKFNFTNTGGKPLIINDVKASCGCTTPNWSKAPVLPGAKGFVEVSFDPKGRPGPFDKSITVQSTAIEPQVILRIAGDVTAREKSIEELYPTKLGSIRLKNNNIALSKVYIDQIKTVEMEMINTSSETVVVGFPNVPSHIKILCKPESLAPNQKGVIQVTFDAATANDWGYVSKWIQPTINGKTIKERIVVSAIIEEDFSNLSAAQLANSAKVEFSENTFSFGSIKQNDVVEHEFIIKNIGNANLIIRKVSASCGCTAAKPETNTIAPGESTSLKVKFDSRGKSGNQNKTVTVITNDPKNSKTTLWVKGMVESNK